MPKVKGFGMPSHSRRGCRIALAILSHGRAPGKAPMPASDLRARAQTAEDGSTESVV